MSPTISFEKSRDHHPSVDSFDLGHTLRKSKRQLERFVAKFLGKNKATVAPHKLRRSCTCVASQENQNLNCGDRTEKVVCICGGSLWTLESSQRYNSNLNCAFLADQSSVIKRTGCTNFDNLQPLLTRHNQDSLPTINPAEESPEISRIPTPQIPLASQDNLTLFEMSLCGTPVTARGVSSGVFQRKRSGSFERGRFPVKSPSIGDYAKIRQTPSGGASATSLYCSKVSRATQKLVEFLIR